jgi:ketosteroid isomerase-like protein
MTSPNLALVRSVLPAWERGDWSSVEWADPEIEFVIADGPTPGTWKGLARMAEGARETLSPWDGFRIEVEEYRELDDEQVLVLYRFAGRGKTSGLDLDKMQAKGAYLFRVRGGKVTRFVIYWNRARALADLALSAEAGSTSAA